MCTVVICKDVYISLLTVLGTVHVITSGHLCNIHFLVLFNFHCLLWELPTSGYHPHYAQYIICQ